MPQPVLPPQTPQRDIAGVVVGLAIVAGCGFVVWEAWGYGLGSARRMGPGAFPFLLGLLGIGTGAAMVLRGLRAGEVMGQRVPLRRLGFILAAFIYFALAIEPLGLILTLFGTTMIGAFGDEDARIGQTLLLAVGLTFAIWLIFVYFLGLSIPVWPGEQ